MHDKLKKIEESLLERENTFGLLTSVGYYDAEADTDIEEYVIVTAIQPRKGAEILIGEELFIKDEGEIKVTAEELIAVFDLFKRLKKELICDLQGSVNIFDLDRYTEKIRKLGK